MKSPDNWAPLVELAALLGAATACSRPVSDEGWRPHEEHTGQTGKLLHQTFILLSVFQEQHSILQVSVHRNILLRLILIKMLLSLKQHNMELLEMQ